ncbi:hypothetical protein Hanom_Chr04g00302911 [Helianthus anomalus]
MVKMGLLLFCQDFFSWSISIIYSSLPILTFLPTFITVTNSPLITNINKFNSSNISI